MRPNTKTISNYQASFLALRPLLRFIRLAQRRKPIGPQSLGCAFLLSSPLCSPCTPLLFSPSLASPPFIFLFLFFHIESFPEDPENNLTSQLSLKQCGLGPRLCSVYRGESTASKGQPGPLALRRTRQVAPHFFPLVWCKNRNKHHSEFYDFENVNTDYSFVISA